MSKHLKKHAGRHLGNTLIALLIYVLILGVAYYLLLRPGSPLSTRLASRSAEEPRTTVAPPPVQDASDEPTATPVPPSTVPDPTAAPEEGEPTSVPEETEPVSVDVAFFATATPVPESTAAPEVTPQPEDAAAPEVTLQPEGTEPAVQATEEPAPEASATPEAPAETAAPVGAPPVELEYPYYIEVDRGQQVVRVYTVGPDGEYSILARTMICSTDMYGNKPPKGLYRMDGEKLRWLGTVSGTAAQYGTRIASKILFHSITYTMWYANTIEADAYKALGTNASAGCVRLTCADAKWIFDHVPAGTAVRFMSSERDEALLQQLAVPPLGKSGFDPTDNRDNNPDYDPSYEESKPEVTPYPGVTPAPTDDWTFETYTSPVATN